MFPPIPDLGLCPLCKGLGFKRESDFTKIDCICEETGNKFFQYKFEPNNPFSSYIKVSYTDKTLFDKIKDHLAYGVVYYKGTLHNLYINSSNRIEPFYSLDDYHFNNYHFPPLEDPLFPFDRHRILSRK